jgi:hypothetical protein
MKFVTSRQLDEYPAALTTVGDKVVVLGLREGATFLEAYDAHLAPVWSKRIGAGVVALLSVEQTLWVLDPEGACAFGDGGNCLARVKVQPREGMRLSAFATVGDGFMFLWQHDHRAPMCPPTLERVNSAGTVRWSVTLPMLPVGYEGLVGINFPEDSKPDPMDPWMPETWFSTSETLFVSGDAVLACFSEMPSSGIGFGYVVSLTDGALRFTTQMGPISHVAPIDGGAFLVGYVGYGAFETLRYDRDGRVPERWASHGHYLVGDDMRVIELGHNTRSKTHLTRLLPGGAVTNGEQLDGYASRPFLAGDGTAYFFCKVSVLKTPDLSIAERLVLTAPEDSLFSSNIVGDGHVLFFAHAKKGGTSLVRIDL